MIKDFEQVVSGVEVLLRQWEPKLAGLTQKQVSAAKNKQQRNIKQILGHMVDSASNNTHRVIHLQYSPTPLVFPNYATNGNNDRWIAIQNYNEEDWHTLVNLWKYSNLHFIHVVKNINPAKLDALWLCGGQETVSLKESVIAYLRHFKLHLDEIEQLIKNPVL